MEPIIEVQKISKKYQIGAKQKYITLRESIVSGVNFSLNRFQKNTFESQPKESIFWALRNVSFNVMPGEILGIIGANGAGKSTILKILSRITYPTSGEVKLRGRVVSLLEVGTGFHQELTGRENIFLNGAVLGMKRAEIRMKFDEIVSFSGVEKFIDTPVKHYSSGMYVRLAFAVAAHLNADILFVDEVLSVGDIEFQKKSLGRMEKITKEGRTVIFVSHNLDAIGKLCDKVIYLEHGRIVEQSSNVSEVITRFLKRSHMLVPQSLAANRGEYKSKGLVRFNNIRTVNDSGSALDTIIEAQPFRMVLVVQAMQKVAQTRLTVTFVDENGRDIATSLVSGSQEFISLKKGLNKFEAVVSPNIFVPGTFSVRMTAMGPNSIEYDAVRYAHTFRIAPKPSADQFTFACPGVIRMTVKWQI